MKNLKKLIAVVAVVALSVPAFAGGESEARALKTTEKMRIEIFDRVDDLKVRDFAMEDATVEVSFFINKEGDVAIENISSENCTAKSYVAQLLQSEKMYVAEELQNTRHRIKIRYVMI